MKKITSNIACFISGIIMASAVGVIAASYTATENVFPIKVNGQDVQMEGYNIEGSTYFKLRDIGDKMGFDVGFENNTILIGKNNTAQSNNINIDVDTGEQEFLTVTPGGTITRHLKIDSFNLENATISSNTIMCEAVFSGTEYVDNEARFYVRCLDKNGIELKKIYIHQTVTKGEKFKARQLIIIPIDTANVIPVK